MAYDLCATEDMTCLQTIETHTNDVTSVDFGNHAMLASGSGDGMARLWIWDPEDNCYTEASYSPLIGHKYGVNAVCFSPQGTMLLTGSGDGSSIIWNVSTGARIHSFVPTTAGALRVCRFAPDSRCVLTAGDDGAIRVWDLMRRSLNRCVWAHEDAVYALAPTPDGRLLLSGCSNGTLRVWALADAEGGEGAQAAAQGTPSSPRQAAALSGSTSPLETPLARVEGAHDLGVLAGDISPQQLLVEAELDCEEANETSDCGGGVGRLQHRYLAATGGNDNAVRLWELRSPACGGGCGGGGVRASIVATENHHALVGHGSAVTSVRFARAGILLLSASLDKTARIWHVLSGTCLSVVRGHSRFVFAVAASRCGTLLATGSYDQKVRVWALSGDRRPPPPPPPRSAARHLLPSPGQEQSLLERAEAEGGAAPSLLQRLQPTDSGAVNGLAFGPAGRILASAHGDKMVRLWVRDSKSSRFEEAPCSPLEGHRYSVLAAEFAPGPVPQLATCSLDGEALLWDIQAGERAESPLQCAGGSALRTLRMSPDGYLLATAGDDETVCVWSLTTGEQLLSAEGHTDAVSGLAISPDSQLLASCSADGSIRLWALAPPSSQCLFAAEAAHDLGALTVDFSPSEGLPGKRRAAAVDQTVEDTEAEGGLCYLLASGGNDETVRLWRVHAYWENGTLVVQGVQSWRTLNGHSGSVACVRFCPGAGELLASAAMDRATRLWSVYSGECLHVLEGHSSLLTSVDFSPDCTLLATGSLDKVVMVWELPAHLVFQSTGPDGLRSHTKPVVDWTPEDVGHWLREWGLPRLAARARSSQLYGHALLTVPIQDVLTKLQVDSGDGDGDGTGVEDVDVAAALEEGKEEEDETQAGERVVQLVRWLRNAEAAGAAGNVQPEEEPPDEFLCPITHEVMRDPVICSDGFTYERAALSEWLLGGRFSSPMTNAPLASTRLQPNAALRRRILTWMFGEISEEDGKDIFIKPSAPVAPDEAVEAIIAEAEDENEKDS